MRGFNFTNDARSALVEARTEALRLRHGYVGTEHVLLGLLAQSTAGVSHRASVAVVVLGRLGVDGADLRRRVEQSDGERHGTTPSHSADLPYTSHAKAVLACAMREADALRHNYVGTEHLLLGLLDEERGIACEALAAHGVTRDRALEQVLRVLDDGIPPEPSRSPSTPSEEEPGRLTDRARRAIDIARSEATRRHSPHVGTEHLLLGLIADRDGLAAALLERLGIDRARIRASVRGSMVDAPYAQADLRTGRSAGPPPPHDTPSAAQALPYSPAVLSALRDAGRDAQQRGSGATGSDHLLVGLLREGQALGARLLLAEGVTLQSVLTERERLTG